MIRNRWFVLGTCLGVVQTSVWAQSPSTVQPPSLIRERECNGEIVSRIDIHPRPPFSADEPKFLSKLTARATALHATTRARLIQRFLTLKVGEACTPFRRMESERILRAQPYLAEVSIVALPDGNGGVVIDVTTVDEVSLVVDGRLSTKSPMLRAARLGESNLAGQGVYLVGGWEHGALYRDIYKARLVDYQFLGRPYQFSVQGARNEIGGTWDVQLSHPFLADFQRISWRASMGHSDGFLYFVRPNAEAAALRLVRAYGDIGGIYAFGSPRHTFLIGSSISRERERTAFNPVIIRDSAIVQDTSTELTGRYGEHRSTRVNMLLGLRNISFMQVSRFDALEGTQDVRTGVQVSTLIGKGLHINDQDERDLFMSGGIYAGRGSPKSFVAMELMGERRRNYDAHTWDGVLASGRAAWYRLPNARHTLVSDLEWSGGWRQRVPFQLTLSDREGGLRGYGDSQLGGAQRFVMRLEDRMRWGHLQNIAALGSVFFVDAGKLWAGAVPFGTTTDVKFSAGVGILAALPPRSRRTWRVDFALPINDRHDSKFEIRFTNHDFTRWFWREPGDVQTSRERAVPNSVYNWP